MKLAYDRASMAHLLAQDLQPRLRLLLERRIASFQTEWGDLTDWSEIAVIEPGDDLAAIELALGFLPFTRDPDGARFGEPGFRPYWDHLVNRRGWFEGTITYGSAFAHILFVADAEGVPAELPACCRAFAR